MNLSQFTDADPAVLAELVPQLLSDALERPNLDRMRELTSVVSPSEWSSLIPVLGNIGGEHRVYPAHPGLRRVSRGWMRDLLVDPVVDGLEHFHAALACGPTVLVTNHLSYVDANAKDALLMWAAGAEVADRVAFLAGPKVYQELFRRVSVGGIASLPVPQSSRLGHNVVRLPPRELAALAFQTVEASCAHLEEGGILAFYPEGSRSRSGRLGPFFKGTRRYLKSAVRLVPAALIGTDEVMRVGDDKIRPAMVSLRFGVPIDLESVPSREALGIAFQAIAALLPPQMQPEEGTAALQ